jgi:hypothetical protein
MKDVHIFIHFVHFTYLLYILNDCTQIDNDTENISTTRWEQFQFRGQGHLGAQLATGGQQVSVFHSSLLRIMV